MKYTLIVQAEYDVAKKQVTTLQPQFATLKDTAKLHSVKWVSDGHNILWRTTYCNIITECGSGCMWEDCAILPAKAKGT